MMRAAPWILVGVLACSGEPEIFSDEIPIAGVSTEPGSLAGTFALKLVVSIIIDLPLFGDEPGGGDSWFRVVRTWDDSRYTEVHEVCGGVTYEVLGTETTVPIESWRKLPPATSRDVSVDHDVGRYGLDGHLELWGLAHLPDPYATALPQDEDDAGMPPHTGLIVDTDEDGNLGVTAHVVGFASGDVFFVQRRVIDLDGVVTGADRIVGLNRTRNEQRTIGSTNSFLNKSTDERPNPDPQESWFEQTRVPDGTDCVAITGMVEAGTLGRRRPF